ncbi:MAG: cyclic nucleotide-binding domain-containing protein [Chloroflexi bacterium]|nr:cyclic nucleotide-binding domain-containing protein [Chloroflexota bacterium]
MKNGEELFGSVYERGAVIFRQGELGDTMYIIQAGAVQISHKEGGSETVLHILEKGDFFGEMALFQKEQRSATVTAIRQTRLLPLTHTSLLERMRQDPGVTLHLLKGLIFRIQRVDRRLKQMVENDEFVRSAMWGDEEDDAGALPSNITASPTSDPVGEVSDRAENASVSISFRELADVWDVDESTWFDPEENIFLEGEPGDAMYIILSGTVEISRGSGQNKWALNHLKSGNFFGEMAIITDRLRSASAAAITRTQLMVIKRDEFSAQIKARPELALYIIQSLSTRLGHLNAILTDPLVSIDAVRQSWRPLLKKHEPVTVSIVSLSTCAGCSAVLLDDEVLAKVLEMAEIIYCPMLMDRDNIQEADVALIDGVVRLKEDEEKLAEARRKSRFVAAWGTCASFGGIPAKANRFELEELVEETYGHTDDAFAYYLSGKGGIEESTYQEKGIALLRKAYKLDDFVRVDYYVTGCPPTPDLLLQLLGELTGQGFEKARPVVCGQCGRKVTKTPLTSLAAFPHGEQEFKCFNSLGIFCLGFLTKGGCGAVCPQNGLPCWGCRGPAKAALKKMADGDSFEEVVIKGLARRCRLEEDNIRALIKLVRKQGHNLFNFERNFISSLARIR